MDNLLEILVPLIFIAIYFFGNLFSGKSEDENTPPNLSRRRGSEDPEPDVAERQRRIQEEIRRKIMERRRASEGGQATPAPTGRELRERRQEVEARREVAQETREKPAAYTVPTREAKRESDSQKFSWDKSDNAYDNTIQARLKRIEETKRKAEKLKKQAAERSETSKGRGKQRKQRSGGYFSGTVRESLQDPQAARVAFIYGEVLGRPISMRKEASSVPGLN